VRKRTALEWISYSSIAAYFQDEKDPAKVTAFYNEAVKDLTVLKRSAIVNQLYGGWKLVVEKQDVVRERGTN
jgi:LYR motif-containing protein 4